jgi:hypothetical protein
MNLPIEADLELTRMNFQGLKEILLHQKHRDKQTLQQLGFR